MLTEVDDGLEFPECYKGRLEASKVPSYVSLPVPGIISLPGASVVIGDFEGPELCQSAGTRRPFPSRSFRCPRDCIKVCGVQYDSTAHSTNPRECKFRRLFERTVVVDPRPGPSVVLVSVNFVDFSKELWWLIQGQDKDTRCWRMRAEFKVLPRFMLVEVATVFVWKINNASFSLRCTIPPAVSNSISSSGRKIRQPHQSRRRPQIHCV